MTTAASRDRLYRLLPAVVRIRDADHGGPLLALLRVVGGELDRIDGDIAQLHENSFIETCDEWVVPYIGDLLRVRPIHSVESARVTTRAYVANTLAYRRRKGTAAVLEQLARDVSGWPARAVEFFARLATTQYLNHVRTAPPATPAIRDAEAAELTGTPFDRFAHTLEVRRVGTARGRYNIPNVGIYLWRLQTYPIGRGDDQGLLADYGTAREQVAPGSSPARVYYTFHPVGLDAPLFNSPKTEEAITHLAEEQNVPGPLRRLALHEELETLRAGEISSPPDAPTAARMAAIRFMREESPALRVLVQQAPGEDPIEVPRERIYVCEIPDEIELSSPTPLAVAIDSERGRLALPAGMAAHRVFVTYNYGFPGALGGGPYDRRDAVDEETFAQPAVWQVGVSHLQTDSSGLLFPSLEEAVAAWNLLPPGRVGVIVLMDSLTEAVGGSPAGAIEVILGEGSNLLIAAADWPLEADPGTPGVRRRFAGHFEPDGVRPHLIGNLVVRGVTSSPGARPGGLVINGLLLEGSLIVADGDLGELAFVHSTLVPERGTLSVEGGNDRLRIRLRRSIAGSVLIPEPIDQLSFVDCLVSGEGAGSPAALIDASSSRVSIDNSTIFGAVEAQILDASNSIFTVPAYAVRRQTGCVCFCYVPGGSVVPRRYRCQPDMEIASEVARARDDAAANGVPLTPADEQRIGEDVARQVVPLFDARQFGDPEFGQLARRCPVQIRTGADNGSEMGAFNFLRQVQREANIRIVLDEYLRFGMEAGLFFVGLPRRKERQ